MHSLARVIAAAALTCLPGLALAGPAEDANAVIDHWVAAFSANDADALVKLYAPDAILLGTSSPVMSDGTAAIRGYFARLPRSGSRVVIRELRLVVLADDAVLATGFYDFSLSTNANPTAAPARFTMVVVRRGDEWVIVHHHSSPRTKQPM
jgi:uncharacterized protein (TIGR02246 family)